MPENKINDGDIVWSISPDNESQNYEDDRPRFPWRGKAYQVHCLCDNPVFEVHKFDQFGTPDTDSNATATLYRDQIYTDEIDALDVFLKMSLSYKRSLLRQIDEHEVLVRTAFQRIDQMRRNESDVETGQLKGE